MLCCCCSSLTLSRPHPGCTAAVTDIWSKRSACNQLLLYTFIVLWNEMVASVRRQSVGTDPNCLMIDSTAST